ncbi:hypothetical protein NECAME_01392 [Necator americanus]|nr:hypothetical protein NECAME_01392 [Necator americanus]ETN85503.1 hypothetical protein NECAME_01392 [Necator americanus]
MRTVGNSSGTAAAITTARARRWIIVAQLGNLFLLIVLYLHAYVTFVVGLHALFTNVQITRGFVCLQSVECDLLGEEPVKDFENVRTRRSAKRTLPLELEEYTIILGQNTLIPV